MNTPAPGPEYSGSRGRIRAPQNLAGGILLLLLAALALWLMRDLPKGTLSSMGPAMLPDWLAVGVGLCGIALLVAAFTKAGDALESWGLRGPLLIMLAILAFAATIRPFSLGGLSLPGLGMVVAGPLAIIIGGCATPEARIRELVVLALCLTPFCMLLFGDMLNLPIPIFPQSFAALFPADWSQKAILRATAAAMVVVAIVMIVSGRRRRSTKVDVAVETEEG